MLSHNEILTHLRATKAAVEINVTIKPDICYDPPPNFEIIKLGNLMEFENIEQLKKWCKVSKASKNLPMPIIYPNGYVR